ncbi:MAG: chorismate mutase [bacterium]|nr:chorismate mutase [bacterium]
MPEELENLRKKIDKIDFRILQNLAERFALVLKVAECKVKNNLPIFAVEREKKMIEIRKILAKKYKLDESMVKRLFKLILKTSRSKQKNAH